LQGKNVVSVLGVPLFTTDAVEDVPDVFAPPPQEPKKKGVVSGILDSLNPFSSKEP
jgi:hypothetical protein